MMIGHRPENRSLTDINSAQWSADLAYKPYPNKVNFCRLRIWH